MGRPSALTEKQWREIEKRLLEGEKIRPLSREFRISEAAIRKRVGTQTKDIKRVANQLLETERALTALPVSAQLYAVDMANKLRSISGHLASAANYGAMTSHRVAGLANQQAEKINDDDPIDDAASFKTLQGITALTKLANESAEIGMRLLQANKDAVDRINKDGEATPMPATITIERKSARITQ